MTDTNNSKMPSNNSKMLSQKVCKCGNAALDLLERIDGFSENLRKLRFGESPQIIKSYEESVNYVHGGITNVESFCDIDTRKEQRHYMDAFHKISEMTSTTDLAIFRLKRDLVIDDLSKIRSNIKEKIRRCSL